MATAKLFAAASWATLLVASSCTAYRHQHAPAPRSGSESAAATIATAAAGAEFRALATADQLGRLRGETAELKARLDAEGRYGCCVEPSCNQCLHQRGECPCHHEVEADGPCGECTQAWAEGRGAMPGIDARELLLRKLRQLDHRAVEDGGHHH
jgi:hypothetical protein